VEKRYQVFVSSTFRDLEMERQEVMHALLELDCMPSGMELFPAANETQWNLIKKVIDDCDYYVLILGGRYGSIGPEGISYTEMEYQYALSTGKPTIAFLHRNPGKIIADNSESTAEGKEKLQAFRESVEKKLCKHWESPQELGSVVSRSLFNLSSQRRPLAGYELTNWPTARRQWSFCSSGAALKICRPSCLGRASLHQRVRKVWLKEMKSTPLASHSLQLHPASTSPDLGPAALVPLGMKSLGASRH
jgi:hypothetical protein